MASGKREEHQFLVTELVLVVVVVGLLMATALPGVLAAKRQLNQSTVVENTATALQAAIDLYHSQWLLAGRPPAHTVLEGWNGIRVNSAGYPYGRADNRNLLQVNDGTPRADESSAVASAEDCVEVVRGLLMHQTPSISIAQTQAKVRSSRTEITAVLQRGLCHYYFTGFSSGRLARGSDTLPVLVYAPSRGEVIASSVSF